LPEQDIINIVKRRFEIDISLRLLLLLVCLLVLGLSPRPHAFDQALRQARGAIAVGGSLRASQALAQAANLAPWRADLWEQAGLYAFQAGELQAAVGYLQRSAAISPLSQAGLVALGQANRQTGDLPAALAAWGQALDRYGPSKQVLQDRSQAYLEQGDYSAALADWKDLAELQPEDAALHFRLGLLLATQDPPAGQSYLDQAAGLDERYQPAAAALRRAVLSARFADEPAYTLLAAGRALADLGEWSLAARAFQQATALRPDYAEAWAYLGEARQHTGQGTFLLSPGDPGDGLAELRQALALDPQSLSAHTFLALYYARHGSFELALESLRQAIALDRGNLALQVQLAGLLAASGDLYQAREIYLQILQSAPQDPTYARLLVQFCLDYDFEVDQTALPLARRLAAQYPGDPASLDVMAQVLIQQNDLHSARRFLERALALDKAYAAARLHLGQVYLLQGDSSSALRELSRVISLAPGSAEAAQAQRLLADYLR
jgi:tetratricopeptide (TPR) repeat protein